MSYTVGFTSDKAGTSTMIGSEMQDEDPIKVFYDIGQSLFKLGTEITERQTKKDNLSEREAQEFKHRLFQNLIGAFVKRLIEVDCGQTKKNLEKYMDKGRYETLSSILINAGIAIKGLGVTDLDLEYVKSIEGMDSYIKELEEERGARNKQPDDVDIADLLS